MRHTYIALFVSVGLMLAACSSGVGTNTGSGTKSLLVRATVSFNSNDDAASLEVHVEKAGQNVDNAKVRITSGRGALELGSRGGGDYRGSQMGYADDGYAVDVTLADTDGRITDELHGSVIAPEVVRLTAPDLTRVVDARALPNNVLVFSWAGPGAESARFRLKGFDSGNQTPDPLRIEVPATSLKEQADDLEVRRVNDIELAGGLAGSSISVEYHLRTTLFVMNPF